MVFLSRNWSINMIKWENICIFVRITNSLKSKDFNGT